MHGVVPGPDMLKPESAGGNLSLTYSFVWILVISNIITVAVIFLLLRQIVAITTIRGALLIPFILMLIYLGAYAEKNAFPDLMLVLFFGFLGWLLEKCDWPRPPLILGLVLGNLAESRLFLSVANYGLSWLYRPLVLVLIAATLLGIAYPLIRARRDKLRAPALAAEGGGAQAPHRRRPIVRLPVIFTLCVALVMALALWESRHFNFRAGLFPWAIGFPILVLTLAQLAKELSGGRADPRKERDPDELPPEVVTRRTALMFAWIFGFFLAIWLIGFPIGGALCCFLHLKLASREKWWLTLLLTFGLWAFIYVLFEKMLHVPFPPGYLFQLLGWGE